MKGLLLRIFKIPRNRTKRQNDFRLQKVMPKPKEEEQEQIYSSNNHEATRLELMKKQDVYGV